MAKFKTRARTLDMLGRQQIAGIPTAISELFKNAYDAYAKNVEVDYFRTDGLFILRDDGIGMTKKDFETRWLTIGTESKVDTSIGISKPYIPPGEKIRPVMGEKGIGRLAISVIGPQVLILTRAIRDDGLQPLVAAFIHWGLFEIPGIDLDQIEIPIAEFETINDVTLEEVQNLAEGARRNILDIGTTVKDPRIQKFLDDLNKFNVVPSQLKSYLDGFSSIDRDHGTHFYILPSDEIILQDISKNNNITVLQKMLLGFTNTMLPDQPKLPIMTHFRDHLNDYVFEDIINENNFWSPADFDNCDHHIKGTINEFGLFEGKVKIYKQEPIHYILPYSKTKGSPTECGPFTIEFGYIQGLQSQSLLEPEKHISMLNRLDDLGGIYIYKDDIRILPYGDSDFDYLDIEKNRTKKASRYFFSYRRMFGAIKITHNSNGALQEKSGREGFRDNKAYRQFREILQNLFRQLATEFFTEKGDQADLWSNRRSELMRFDAVKKEREKQATAKRKKFTDDMEIFYEGLGKLGASINNIVEHTKERISFLEFITQPESKTAHIIEVEKEAVKALGDLRSSLKVSKPNGVALNKQQRRDWEYYQSKALDIHDAINKAETEIHILISEISNSFSSHFEKRKRVEESLSLTTSEARKIITEKAKDARTAAQEAQNSIQGLTRRIINEFTNNVNLTFNEFLTTDLSNFADESLVNFRISLENKILQLTEENQNLLDKINDQLKNLVFDISGDNILITTDDLQTSLQEEILDLKEKIDNDLELTQMGMAIGIINHEFEQTVRAIRRSLKELKSWAEENPILHILYTNINNSFEHIDGYLSLFTPLQRRIYRNPVEISGYDIKTFLENLFRERLQKEKIDLRFTSSFSRYSFQGYPSSIYPVFINLIDNAIYWVATNSGEKLIELDYINNTILISDNGPGIREQDIKYIFELGFTKKPGGRGMGLYISKSVLEKSNYRIELSEPKFPSGTTFAISEIGPHPEEEGKR